MCLKDTKFPTFFKRKGFRVNFSKFQKFLINSLLVKEKLACSSSQKIADVGSSTAGAQTGQERRKVCVLGGAYH